MNVEAATGTATRWRGADSSEGLAAMPGDDLLQRPDAVMDRAFTVNAPPDVVWPWLVQLGKERAGWYLPKRVERAHPAQPTGHSACRPAVARHGTR